LWNSHKYKIMSDITFHKYKVCEEARLTLLATKNAQLWHIVERSSKHIHVKYLELREYIKVS
jgi:hypothetical protein